MSASGSPRPRPLQACHTVPQAAEMLAVSVRTIWRLIAAQELTAVRLGRSVRVSAESVQALVARGGTGK